MRIVFGWNLDQSPWMPGSGGGTTVVTGPLGLLGVLQTRLGTTRPAATRPTRIAQYRSLMGEANHHWYRTSFEVDPWNTAAYMLRLRDDAIEAGWTPQAATTSQPRLDAIADVESLVRLESSSNQPGTLAPGRADDLREVLEFLRDSGSTWPLGITAVELRDDRSALPQIWRDIFTALETAGVTVSESSPVDSVPATFTVVRGVEQWSIAEAAARWLANTADLDRLCIVAGGPTATLDEELNRRGLPSIGMPSASAKSPASQLLSAFLSAVLPPTDVRRVAELLSFEIGMRPDSSFPIRLVPNRVATTLLTALTQEPGISSDPESAWMSAMDVLNTPEPDPAARELDKYLRTSPPVISDDQVDLSSLEPALIWLSARLLALRHGLPSTSAESVKQLADVQSFLAEATGHVDSVRTALAELGADVIRVRELFDIVDSCAPAPPSATTGTQAAQWTVVTDPAQIPTGTDTVLWWSAHRSAAAEAELWDPAETTALAHAGAIVSSAADRESLHQAATLRALRGPTTLISFIPERINGTEVSLNPSLTRLAEVMAAEAPERFGSRAVDGVFDHPTVSRPVHRLTEGHQWQLNSAVTTIAEVKLEVATPPTTVSREVHGNFVHLLPDRLSYTQIERLLSDPLAWTLQEGIGLKRGFVSEVPTGNRMIGTFVHAVVERLVRHGEATGIGSPTSAEIRSAFDALAPRFAAELLLPGSSARTESIRATTVGSLTQMFASLKQRGITLTAAETEFSHPWALSLNGGTKTVDLIGLRDLDGELADGRPAVIDLKWANSARRFRTMVDDGEAVQLSIYTHNPDNPEAQGALTAFYLLKQGRFVSADSGLDPDFTGGGTSGDDEAEGSLGGNPAALWPRIQHAVEHALGRIASGRFDAPIADAYAQLHLTPGESSKALTDRLKELRAGAIDEGLLFVDKPQAYSEFNLIYGIAGGHS